jgi:hypothetical protein
MLYFMLGGAADDPRCDLAGAPIAIVLIPFFAAINVYALIRGRAASSFAMTSTAAASSIVIPSTASAGDKA